MPDDGTSYYVLMTVNKLYFYLDLSEGDRLCTELDQLRDNYYAHERDPADKMFLTFTDQSGSEGRIRAAQIEALYTSTPATRERDEELRAARKEDRKWDEE